MMNYEVVFLFLVAGHVQTEYNQQKKGGTQIMELVVLDPGRVSHCIGDEGCYLNYNFNVILQFVLVVGKSIKEGIIHIEVSIPGVAKSLLNQDRKLCKGQRPMSLSLSKKCPNNAVITNNNYTVTAKVHIPAFKGSAILSVHGPAGASSSKKLFASRFKSS